MVLYLQHYSQIAASQKTLDDIGSVQTVNAVCPKDALLQRIDSVFTADHEVAEVVLFQSQPVHEN